MTIVVSVPEKGAGRAAKVVMKKQRSTKFDYIKIEGASRCEFIVKMLGVHDLDDQFAPGVHSGPSFKLWFTGSK